MNAAAKPWQTRRVDEALRVSFAGHYWSVLNLPGVHVGDLVQCQPTRRGAFLHVRDANGLPSSTLASRIEPVRNHPHTCPLVGTLVSSGSPTTSSGPAPQSSSPGQRAASTPQPQPVATPLAHSRSRNAGTAAGAVGADSIASFVALVQSLALSHGSQGTGKSRVSVSLRISFKRGRVNALCQINSTEAA